GSAHCDTYRIGCAGKSAGARAAPTGEIVARRRLCSNFHTRTTGLPSAGRSYRAASISTRGQEILNLEFRNTGLVGCGGDGVRDSSAVTPTVPYKPNACATALR